MAHNQKKFCRIFPASFALVLAVFAVPLHAEEPQALAQDSINHPFDKGSRLLSFTAGASRDHSLGEIYLTQFNVSHYLFDNLAFHYGASFGYADMQRAHDGFQGGPEFGLRWHFLRSERWSLYAEGLAAAIVHQHPLTENSLHFNFDLQPGCGITYRLNQDTMVESGFRWHHLSNARIRGKEHNLGYDGPMVYAGVKKSF